ncbi:MAG: indolepyruvate oxidoreductase subunit beta [Eggerthellaceae bacterium]|nr:indolepyruvate oxidoreductase subunit beta [Eggerthellaceae bacterium]
MINILLAGVGGQGTVLAAKVLAQAAQSKGWQVRTAETIGMAQRGGNVTSHVRMGNEGEQVHSSLIAKKTAQLIIAFEPAEAARALEYLAPDGIVVTASSAVQPVTVALSGGAYRASDVIASLRAKLGERLIVVDDAAITEAVGSRKVLNTVLLASALFAEIIDLNLDDLRHAIEICVKPRFIELNQRAIDIVAGA